MAQLLSGRINLSKIPKDLIRYNNAGEAFVWVDVAERRETSQYGDTHNIYLYDSANRQKVYIGELRPKVIPETRTAEDRARAMGPGQSAADVIGELRPTAPTIPNYKPMSGADEASLDLQPGDLPY